MEQQAMHFEENGISTKVFHKNKRHININKADIEETVLSYKNHIVKIHLNTLLDTDIKVMFFHHHVRLPQMLNIFIKIINT